MKTSLGAGLLSRMSEFVDSRMALYFPPQRWSDLERMATAVYREMGYADPESFVEGLLSSPLTMERMEMLASCLTVGETYFWREPRVFEALEDSILPEMARSRGAEDRRLRIWCAGCSTGEEAYSVAVALRRAIPAIDEWKATVLATDINTRTLRKAEAGVYGEWSFRNAPPWLAGSFFRPGNDGKHEILPEIRKMVSFEYLNLVEDAFPSSLNDTNAMDVIFCRNVLMYFSPERARVIVDKLHRALVDGGWLIVSACECSQARFSGFTPVQFPGATGYLKYPKHPLAEEPPRSETTCVARSPRRTSSRAPAATPPRPVPTPASAVASSIRSATAPSARELADEGRLAEALVSCDAAIAADKLDPRLHKLRASILQELNRGDEAIASLKRSIYLDPESAPAYFALGNLALRSGDRRMGRRSLVNALSLLAAHPDDEILPDSDGLTAGRFKEIISATMQIRMEAK
jgi:chemotaxis protein methyltransferase CheR